MKPAWYKTREPVIEQVERLPDGRNVYRYTEFNPMTGRGVSKYAVAWDAYDARFGWGRPKWFDSAAAAKMAHAMAPSDGRWVSMYHDDMMDAYTYLLKQYCATGTGVTKITVGTP